MLSYILVFLAVAIVDIFWTQYIIAAQNHRFLQAGLYSLLIILIGAFSTRSYVHDGMMVIPAALGAFVGTALTVLYNKRKHASS